MSKRISEYEEYEDCESSNPNKKIKLSSDDQCSHENCAKKPLYKYEQNNEAYCEDHKIHELIVKNNENAVEIISIQRWLGWCEIDICKKCNKGPISITYEVHWDKKSDGSRNYCSEMCHKCLKDLAKLDPDIQSEEYRNAHPEFDAIAKKHFLI